MGQIGRWIDERCQAEPDVMRRVLNRKWNDLGTFIEHQPCPRGCMIGTYVLVQHPNAISVRGHVDDVGFGLGLFPVIYIRNRLGHATAVRLLKQRIRKSLGLAPVRQQESGSVGAVPGRPPEEIAQ